MSQASKDIPQDYPTTELWDAFQSDEVASVFREEFGKRYCLHEFIEDRGLEKTRMKLAEIIEWRSMLQSVIESKPKGGVQ